MYSGLMICICETAFTWHAFINPRLQCVLLQMMPSRCILICIATLHWSLRSVVYASDAAPVDMIVQSGGAKAGDSLQTVCEVLSEGRHVLAGTPSCSILCPAKADAISSSPPIQCCLSGLCYVLGAPGSNEGSCQLCSAQSDEKRPEDGWCDTPRGQNLDISALLSMTMKPTSTHVPTCVLC